jgi:hypothetical protein
MAPAEAVEDIAAGALAVALGLAHDQDEHQPVRDDVPAGGLREAGLVLHGVTAAAK